jgi:hypothetical protein
MINMKINLKLDKETAKKVGRTSWRISKAVVIRGLKGIAQDAAIKTINTTFTKGPKSVGKMDLDYFIGEETVKEKSDKTKKKWFSKKEKAVEELAEEIVDSTEEAAEVVEEIVIDEN